MRRAAVSIPSNIAEGACRGTTKEFAHFLAVAQGSLAELDTQLELCSAYLGLLPPEAVTPVFEKIERVGKMLTALRRSLRTREGRPPHDERPTTNDQRRTTNGT